MKQSYICLCCCCRKTTNSDSYISQYAFGNLDERTGIKLLRPAGFYLSAGTQSSAVACKENGDLDIIDLALDPLQLLFQKHSVICTQSNLFIFSKDPVEGITKLQFICSV